MHIFLSLSLQQGIEISLTLQHLQPQIRSLLNDILCPNLDKSKHRRAEPDSSNSFTSEYLLELLMESTSKTLGVPDLATRGTANLCLSGHSASITVFNEEGGAACIQFPDLSHSNQGLISSPLNQKLKTEVAYYDSMTSLRYTQHISNLNFSSMSGATRSTQTTSRSSEPAASRSRSRCRPSRERRTEKRMRNPKRRDHPGSLGRALSEIATEVPHILVPDAAAFATRAIELRREEAASAGKIKRPLNAFMLYRRSYQNVAKTCCTRNNHQQVSAVCGDSWTSCEPQDIVGEFNRLATIERQMHEQAFPNYKYDPLHTKKGDDKDEAPSPQLGTIGLEHVSDRGFSRANIGRRTGRKTLKYSEFPHSNKALIPQLVDEQQLIQARPLVSHSYWTPSAMQPYSIPYSEDQHAFLDPGSFQPSCIPSGEDRLVCSSSSPAFHGLYADTVDHGLLTEIYIDPALLPCQPSMVHGLSNYSYTVPEQWHRRGIERSRTEVMMPDLDMEEAHDAYLRGTKHDWKIEQLEEPSQFEDWMSQTDI